MARFNKESLRSSHFVGNWKIIRDGKADEVLDYYNAIIAKKEKDEIRQLEHISGRKITRSGNAKAEITSIELLNLALEESRCFISGERAIIRLVVHFNQSLKSPTYGILISIDSVLKYLGPIRTTRKSMNSS